MVFLPQFLAWTASPLCGMQSFFLPLGALSSLVGAPVRLVVREDVLVGGLIPHGPQPCFSTVFARLWLPRCCLPWAWPVTVELAFGEEHALVGCFVPCLCSTTQMFLGFLGQVISFRSCFTVLSCLDGTSVECFSHRSPVGTDPIS